MTEPCTILSLVATPTACVDGYYNLDITITFSNPPGMENGDGTTGTLIISTNCGGGGDSPFVIPSPFPDLAVITETATINSILANGVVCTLSAYFISSDPYAEPCEFSIEYEAPSPCFITWPYYVLTPCCGEGTITLRPESKSDEIASGVYLYTGPTTGPIINGQCYTVVEFFGPNEKFPDIDDYLAIPLVPPNPELYLTEAINCNDLDVCPSCDPVCYTLYSCDGLFFNTISDLSDYLGEFVSILESGIPVDGTWLVTLNSGKCDIPVNEITVSEITPEPCVCRCFEIVGTVKQIRYVNCDGELQKLSFSTDVKFCAYTYPFVSGTPGQYQIREGGACVDGECPILCYELTECTTGEIITSQSQGLYQYFVSGQVLELVGHPGCWEVTSDAAEDCTCPVDLTVTVVNRDCAECIGIIAYKLTNCENTSDIKYTYDDLSEYIGQTLRTDCGCYIVELIDFEPTSTSPIVIISSFNSCVECLRSYYRLTACNVEEPDVYTFTDLSEYVGKFINIKGCDTCWEVFNTNTPINPGIVTVTDSFELCEDCTPPLPCLCNRMTNYSTTTKAYEYIDCNDNNILITLTAGETSGKICLKRWVTDYPDTDNLEVFGECTQSDNLCYQYEITVPGETQGILYYKNCNGVVNFQNISLTKFPTEIIICGIDGQTSSDIYLNDLIPVPFEKLTVCNIPTYICPLPVKLGKKIRPGYSVPTCDIDTWEKITCRSAEIHYKEVMRLRYGMSNCCPEDDEKWLIKKELIDLAALVDPDYICSPVQSCGCAPSSCGCSSTLKTCSSQ